MHRIPVLVLILTSLLIPPALVKGQKQPTQVSVLQVGPPIERTIGPGQSHFYILKLEAEQFAQVVIEQRGIDVIISVTDPQSKTLGEFDTPNGDTGPESIPIVAEVPGDYTLAVSPLNQGENIKPGKYEIQIVELRKATEQELKAIVDKEAVRAKALALVNDAALLIPQVHSMTTRVHAQMKTAGLLWETDEKTASKLMSDAVATLKEFLADIDYTDQESVQKLQPVAVLRYELIQALATRDPEAALNFLRATRPPVAASETAYSGMHGREDQLELTLASQVAKRDPKRAYQIAQENLKAGGFPQNLFQTVIELSNSDVELARKLVNEITARLMEEKLLKNREAMQLALGLVVDTRDFNRRRTGPDTNSQSRTGEQGSAVLSDQNRRDILQKLLTEATTPAPAGSISSDWWPEINILNQLKSLGQELEQQIPGSQAAIEKRLAEIQKRMDPQTASWQKYQQQVNNSTPEAAVEVINQSPPELRPQLYQQLADRTAALGDINRARQIINEKITNPWQRRQALENLEQQAVYQSIQKGKIEDALRSVATFRNLRTRAMLIGQIAKQIGPGRKRAVAISLLEQARALLSNSPQADNQEEMNALIELASAFGRYDNKRSFEILDPLVDQFNDINDAARKLSGFSYESHRDGEVDMYNGNMIMNIVSLLGRALSGLAPTNFERARATADRIQATEVRLIIYLEIAQGIVQPTRQPSMTLRRSLAKSSVFEKPESILLLRSNVRGNHAM